MENNKHGRWNQTIVIRVSYQDGGKAERILSCPYVVASDNTEKACLHWGRWSSRRGNDEDIVFELSRIFFGSHIEWQVDWEASVY